MATLGVLLLLVGLDALTSVIDETDDIGDGYGFLDILSLRGLHLASPHSRVRAICGVNRSAYCARSSCCLE